MATDELRAAILKYAPTIGANPVDLATTYSYETGGTLNPWQKGPTTQWGQHRGLIQWGEPQREKYGVTEQTPVADQVAASVQYLKDAGFQPGMGLLDMYSAVNAGKVGRYNASDANNGGASGTVADKVNNQMGQHRIKAEALLGGDYTLGGSTPTMTLPGATDTASGRFAPTSAGVEGSSAPAPAMTTPTAPADEPIDAAKILASLTQQAAPTATAPQAQQTPPMLAPMQRPKMPFDPSAFYALLARKR